MRHFMTLGIAFLTVSLASPLTVTPSTQQTTPGGLVILSASEEVNWSSTGGALGSTHGTRIVFEAPRSGGNITVTAQDPKDATRRAFAVVQVIAVSTAATPVTAIPWRNHTFAAGADFSTAISTDGSLWNWGLNDKFQIPGSKSKNAAIPLRAEGISGVMSVEAALFRDAALSGVALTKNGTLWAWGGKFKTLTSIDKNLTYANYRTCLTVSAGDGGFAISNGNGRVKNDLKQIAYVTSGESQYDGGSSLVILKKDGSVAISPYCNVSSGNKNVDGLSNVMNVTSIFKELYLAQRRDGSVVLINNLDRIPVFQDLAGYEGIMAIGSSSKRGGGGWGYAVMRDGTVRSFELIDDKIPSVPQPVNGLSDIIDVSVSGSHALFLRKDGVLFAIGLNNNGELGNGTMENSAVPVEVIGLKVAVH